MVQLNEEPREVLNQIAGEVRDVFEVRGFNVGKAVALDKAFRRTKRVRSSMVRELINEGVEQGAARMGVACLPGPGGSQELYLEVLGRPSIFRIKTAKLVAATGEYKIVTNNASNWGDLDEETNTLYEPWVFGFTRLHDSLGDLFVAQVNGITLGTPGTLILGAPTLLERTAPTTDGFRPAEEDLAFDGDDSAEERGVSND